MSWRNSSLKHRITRAIGIADHGERVRDLGRLISEGIIEGFKTKEDDNMTNKIHVIADETLGGIKREYVEVYRKADVGESIVIVGAFETCGMYNNGDIMTAEEVAVYGIFNGAIKSSDEDSNPEGFVTDEEYCVLEPTDIVHIEECSLRQRELQGNHFGQFNKETKCFRLVDRKAEVGERVIIVDVRDWNADGYKEGDIFTVMLPGYDVILTDDDITLSDNEYRVLEPVETSPQSTDDIIANLVRRVAELERTIEMQAKENRLVHDNIEGAKRDVETLAQEIEAIKHANKPKQITIDAEVLARLLGGAAND